MLCYGSKVSEEFRLCDTLFNGKPFVVPRLFCFVFVLMLSLKPGPFVQSFSDIYISTVYMQAPRQPQVFLPFFPFFFFGDVAFSEYFFCTIAVFSLYGECAVRFFLPDGVFLPCDHVLDFFTSAYVRIR